MILTEIFAFELAASGGVLGLRLAGSIGSLLGALHNSFLDLLICLET